MKTIISNHNSRILHKEESSNSRTKQRPVKQNMFISEYRIGGAN